ncbi:MAG: tetratricopeptide repeat protein [Treponema sp.]|nr:tetratricopeptide repeat protein [Treponema sp.]MCL2272079.1 tetratricopeptide repeat protein [Treponema sp.]
MLSFSGRSIYAFFNRIRHKITEEKSESKLIADFSKTKKSPFDIKSESSYNAYLSNGSLLLELKKSNCISWIDIPEKEYGDHVIEAKIRLDSPEGYASTGVIFRLMDEDSCYMALVSNKGYFRLDAVKDGSPKALIAWTEVPDFSETNININIITYGADMVLIVNGKWAGCINDDTIQHGKPGFILASYDDNGIQTEKECVCRAWLDYFSVDSRYNAVSEKYKTWTDDSNINADCRLRLAETFAVMGKSSDSLEQIKKAWKRRDEAIRSADVSYTEVRTRKELLLASRMAFNTGQYSEANDYIDIILDQSPDSEEAKTAFSEKIKTLNELDNFGELKEFILKHKNIAGKNVECLAVLGRCCWELGEYRESAEAWEKAFKTGNENGVYAVNAANAWEHAGKKENAVKLYIEAGKIFLRQDNKAELEVMMPRLQSLGHKNWEARALSGKWAYSIENYNHCEEELSAAEKLRCAVKPRPKADPALYYLWGLVLYLKGKLKTSVKMLEKAVRLAPDYELFSSKLKEISALSESWEKQNAGK